MQIYKVSHANQNFNMMRDDESSVHAIKYPQIQCIRKVIQASFGANISHMDPLQICNKKEK